MSFDINETLETAKNIACEAAQVAADKAKELAGITKCKLDILAEQEKVRKAENELGKLCYRDYAVQEEADNAEYLPWLEKIDASKQLIAQLEEKIEKLRARDAEEKSENADGVIIDLPVQPEE